MILLLFPIFYGMNRFVLIFRTIILVFVLVISGKRGPILAFAVAYVISYMANSIFNNRERSNLVKIAFTLGAMALMFFAVFNVSGGTLLNRFSDVRDDGGSGRDVISEAVWYSYITSDSKEKIWGHGFNGVIEDNIYNGISAHNDSLEVLYDYGIVGVVLFMLMTLNILFLGVSSLKRASPNSTAFLFFFICTLFICLVSHIVIYPTNYFELLTVYSILLSKEFQWRNHYVQL